MSKNIKLLAFFSLLLLIGVQTFTSSSVKASPNSCPQWNDCELTLSADLNPVLEYSSNFVLDQETTHFVFFQQDDSPNFGNYDASSYQNMIDQVECGYRYLICEVGLTPVHATQKTHIYVGDHPSSSATYTDYLNQSDYFVTDLSAFDYTYSTMTHELFHKIQSKQYAYSVHMNLTEAIASLAAQLPSELNFETAIVKVGRISGLTSPEYSRSYALNVFLRYMFEQIQGTPLSPLDVNSDWAVKANLSAFMDSIVSSGPNLTLSEYLTNYLPTALNASSTVFSLDNLYDNFQVARYAAKFIDPLVQPQAALQTINMIPWNVQDLNPYSTGNVINVGDILNFDNSNVMYGIVQDYGFQYFLNAEYNILEPDLATVGRLRFEKTLYDDNIRFQVIIKDNVSGTVFRKKILKGATTMQTVRIPANITVSELALVVYTVADNPINTGTGKLFTMTVKGLAP